MKATAIPAETFTQGEIASAAVTGPVADPLTRTAQQRECDVRQTPPDFSLVLGGPLFQLCRRMRLSGDALERLHRRIVVMTLLVWLPLLFLSLLQNRAIGDLIKIPFLMDIEANVRFLVALPVLISAELVVHQRISPLVRRFVERGIVTIEDLPKFNTAVNSALRSRNSVVVEGALLVFVYTVGLWIWRSQVALGDATWYAAPTNGRLHLTLAGYWYVFVSIPVFQFILLRWYVRLVIWFRLLWQISKLNLHLTAAHPDRAGGIGFLGKSSYAFAPILFSQGTILAGLIGTRVLYEGRDILSFKMEAAGLVGFFVAVILGPLIMFTPRLALTQRKGSSEYGLLANRYVFSFEGKWMRSGDQAPVGLLGSEDIQSMSDLASIYANVRQMRIIPFGTDDITRLAVTTAAPLLPLMLTIYSPAELAKVLIKILFR